MRVQVRVKPNSRQARIERSPDGTLTVWLHSPPAEGRANRELIERLAEYFQVPRTQVRIVSGASSRIKLVEIG